MMQNQNQNMQESPQMAPQQNHGGHSLIHAHGAISGIVDSMEQYMLFETQVQDQDLTGMMQRHRTFMTQLYNTLVDTMKTGQDPAVETQSYEMTQSNDVLYGMQPAQPKTPAQSANEINDECISGYMLSCLKSNTSAFTTAALEATNPVQRRVFADSIPNIIEMAYEVFLYQNKHQYYQVPQLKQEDMQHYMNSFAPIQGGTMSH